MREPSAMTFAELVQELAVQAASCPQHGNVSGKDFACFRTEERLSALREELDRRYAHLARVATSR